MFARSVSIPGPHLNSLKVHSFFDCHSDELKYIPRLVRSLEKLRRRHLKKAMVLEIRERSAKEMAQLKVLSKALKKLKITLAITEFASDKSRLYALMDLEPRVIKFDASLIRDLDSASSYRADLIAELVDIVKNKGGKSLAMGVSTASEAKACKELGFDFMEGYEFGDPLILD